eukprot:11080883-Alexandrium_andersonii.AAC.1
MHWVWWPLNFTAFEIVPTPCHASARAQGGTSRADRGTRTTTLVGCASPGFCTRVPACTVSVPTCPLTACTVSV